MFFSRCNFINPFRFQEILDYNEEFRLYFHRRGCHRFSELFLFVDSHNGINGNEFDDRPGDWDDEVGKMQFCDASGLVCASAIIVGVKEGQVINDFIR